MCKKPSSPAYLCILADSTGKIPVTTVEIKHASGEDSVIRNDMKFVNSKCRSFSLNGDLSIASLIFNERVVIPTAFRQKVLRRFHSSHPEINRMNTLAREYSYWSGMNKNIELLTKCCLKCQNAARSPRRKKTGALFINEGTME